MFLLTVFESVERTLQCMFKAMWFFIKERWKKDYKSWFFLLFSITLIFGALTLIIDVMASDLSKYDLVIALSYIVTLLIIIVWFGLTAMYIELRKNYKKQKKEGT